MTELKTLKDFEFQDIHAKDEFTHGTNSENEELIKKLRSEAVKWAKFFYADPYDACRWIKHFFNLTEEDLKNDKT